MSDDGKVVYRITADTSTLDSDLNTASDKIKKTASGWGKTFAKGVAALSTAVAAGTVAVTKAAIDYGSAFEQSMANASTLFGDAAVDTDNLNAKMLDLSDATGIAADELGGALYQALSAGVPASEDMSEALAFLEANTKLSKAGFTDMTTAVGATASVLNAYGKDVSEVDQISKILLQTQNLGITTVDELGRFLSQVTPTASAFGVEFEQVGAALATMTAAGTQTAVATTQLKSLIAELGKSGTIAANNLAQAAEGTQYAGMSFAEMMEKGADLGEVLGMLQDKADKDKKSMVDMFSSIEAGSAALVLAQNNGAKFNAAMEGMSTAANVVGDSYNKVIETTQQKWDKTKNKLKNTAIQLFSTISPLLENLMPLFDRVVEDFLPPVLEMIEKILPPLTDMAGVLMEAISPILDAILPVVQTLLDTLAPIVETVLSVAVPLLQAMLPSIQSILDMLSPLIVMLVEQLLPPLGKLLETILPPLLRILETLLEPVIDLVEMLLPPLVKALESLNPLFEALMPILEFLADIIADNLAGAFETVMGLLEPIMGLFSDLQVVLSDLLGFVTDIFAGDFEGAFEHLKNAVEGIIKAIARFIVKGLEGAINFVIDMINGLIKGIVSAIGWLLGLLGVDAGWTDSVKIGHVSFWDDDNPPAFAQTVPRYARGNRYVQEDWTLAYLDRGERVLTADENQRYTAVEAGIGAALASTAGNGTASKVMVNAMMTGDVVMDGFEVGKVVLRNLDDVAAFTLQ